MSRFSYEVRMISLRLLAADLERFDVWQGPRSKQDAADLREALDFIESVGEREARHGDGESEGGQI